jgi:hypothetical protein
MRTIKGDVRERLGADHLVGDVATVTRTDPSAGDITNDDSGYHRQVTLEDGALTAGNPPASHIRLHNDAGVTKVKDSAGTVTVLATETTLAADIATHNALAVGSVHANIKTYIDGAAGQATTAAQSLGTGDSPTFVQATASGAAPTNIGHLTRKDYVDGEIVTHAADSAIHLTSGAQTFTGAKTLTSAILNTPTIVTPTASGGDILGAHASTSWLSSDGTLSGDAHTVVPTESAVKTYVDGEVGTNASAISANTANISTNTTDIAALETLNTLYGSYTTTATTGSSGTTVCTFGGTIYGLAAWYNSAKILPTTAGKYLVSFVFTITSATPGAEVEVNVRDISVTTYLVRGNSGVVNASGVCTITGSALVSFNGSTDGALLRVTASTGTYSIAGGATNPLSITYVGA